MGCDIQEHRLDDLMVSSGLKLYESMNLKDSIDSEIKFLSGKGQTVRKVWLWIPNHMLTGLYNCSLDQEKDADGDQRGS